MLTINYSLCSIQDSIDTTCVKYIAKFHVIILLHAYINSGALPNKKSIRTVDPILLMWGRSWRCAAVLLPVFCYQLIAKPGNKTATPPWLDHYPVITNLIFTSIGVISCRVTTIPVAILLHKKYLYKQQFGWWNCLLHRSLYIAVFYGTILCQLIRCIYLALWPLCTYHGFHIHISFFCE